MIHPVMNVSGAERGRCCASIHHSLDICGRSDCFWNCPSFEPQFPIPQRDLEKAFFLETSGARNVNFRQACAIESLALMNPHLTVILLMSGKDIDLESTTMKTLRKYDNIKIYVIKLGDYFIHTPLEQWYFCSTWNYGPYAVSHLSDALRFLTLYKYGGYYIDLDIIMIQPVTHYRNFIGAENENNLAAGAFHVDYLHPVIRMAVEEFRDTYRYVR
jgi:lactosylceramide 4-alpha-galactosyltransferase